MSEKWRLKRRAVKGEKINKVAGRTPKGKRVYVGLAGE